MQYTDFGKTGLKVSRFGLGTMRLPADEKPLSRSCAMR